MTENLREFLFRLKNLFRRRRLAREFTEELEFHQAKLRDKLLSQGVAPTEVESAARRAFGSTSRWHECLSEVWQIKALENFSRDVSFSLRLLRKSPGFTSVALLTLALGVGANTTIFSMINGLLFRSLPAPHTEDLSVLRIEEGGPQADYSFCTPFFRILEARHEVFADVFAFNPDELQVRGESSNETVPGELVSGQFFRALQVAPLIGRYLTPEDDRGGGNPNGLAVVISEQFWQRWFHRVPDVIGRRLVIANVPFTVVGVMPKRFIGADPTQRPDIFAPLSADPIIDAPRNHIDAGTHAWWLTVMARRQSGVSLAQANAELLTISDSVLREGAASDPDYIAGEEKSHFYFAVEPGARGFASARSLLRKPLIAMFAMCGGILVLACLNLASLLMARGAARQRELATRLAIGATRRRLMQQLLVESLLIAVMGTVMGLAVAPFLGRSVAMLLMNGTDNARIDTSLDLHVFGFAALVAIVSALLIGLVPAQQAMAGDLSEHIKEGQHPVQPHLKRRLLPRLLLSVEVALALVLVVGAGLLATSLMRLYKSGVGFDPHGLVTIAFSMDKQQLRDDALMRVYQQLGEALSHQPGVKNVSFEFIVPLSHRGWNGRYSAPGQNSGTIFMNSVGPRYFETMRTPMRMGREFTWNDTKNSGRKIILNESAAKLLFPNQAALGQQVVNGDDKSSYEVVAIVGDAKYRDMRAIAPPTGYVPITQDEQEKPSLKAVLRVEGPQTPLAAAARSLAARLAPAIPAPVLTSMEDVVKGSMVTERLMALLSLFFAGCALLVTAIGLYGTLAYATSRRNSEIGIRMALGAGRTQVVLMIFRENAIIAVTGSIVGFALAWAASRTLESFLYGTSTHDPVVLVGSMAALTAIASAASLGPALRAASIEPMAAIRCE